MLAGLTQSYIQSGTSGTEVVENIEERFNDTNYNYGDWNETNDCWICPTNGFYKITGAIRGGSQSTDKLTRFNVAITRYNSSNVLQEDIAYGGLDLRTETSSEADIISANTTTIIYLEALERIKLRVNWKVTSGNLSVGGSGGNSGGSTRPEKTYLMVERIIKGTF